MAKKPFYSMDEVCAKLGKNQDQIKGLVRDGALREFRDAGKVFFKAEDIDKLAGAAEPASKEDTGEILLEPAGDMETLPSGDDMPALTEASSGGTSIIGLEPLAGEGEEKGKTRTPGKKKDDTVVTTKGIGVFDDDELQIDADPMAKTQITTGAVDQISLEGAGSGSGLLDLAREADDTALGADLLDEIYPGEEDTVQAAEEPAKETAEEAPAEEPQAEAALEAVEGGEMVLPALVPTGDPFESLFSGLLVGGLLVMAVAGSVVGGLLQGYLPDYGRFLGDGKIFYFFLGGAVLLAAIALVAGWFIGKAFAPRRR